MQDLGVQDRNVPQHAIIVMAHFLRLEKLTGFRWSPSSKSIYNRENHHYEGPVGKRGRKKTNIDIILAPERLFRCTKRTSIETQTHFTELMTSASEVTIQLLFINSRRQARFSNLRY